jgi:hypothetical protein
MAFAAHATKTRSPQAIGTRLACFQRAIVDNSDNRRREV